MTFRRYEIGVQCGKSVDVFKYKHEFLDPKDLLNRDGWILLGDRYWNANSVIWVKRLDDEE